MNCVMCAAGKKTSKPIHYNDKERLEFQFYVFESKLLTLTKDRPGLSSEWAPQEQDSNIQTANLEREAIWSKVPVGSKSRHID
jgi:hypothetical protein